jgi:hypothetical protein
MSFTEKSESANDCKTEIETGTITLICDYYEELTVDINMICEIQPFKGMINDHIKISGDKFKIGASKKIVIIVIDYINGRNKLPHGDDAPQILHLLKFFDAPMINMHVNFFRYDNYECHIPESECKICKRNRYYSNNNLIYLFYKEGRNINYNYYITIPKDILDGYDKSKMEKYHYLHVFCDMPSLGNYENIESVCNDMPKYLTSEILADIDSYPPSNYLYFDEKFILTKTNEKYFHEKLIQLIHVIKQNNNNKYVWLRLNKDKTYDNWTLISK